MCACVLWTHVDTTPHPVKGSRHVTVNILPSSAEVCLLWRSMWFSWAGIICPRSFPAGVLTTEQHGVRGDFAHSLLFLLLHTWRAFGNLGPQNMVIFFFLPGQASACLSMLELFLGESDQGTLTGPLTLSCFLPQEMLCPKGTSSVSLYNECTW